MASRSRNSLFIWIPLTFIGTTTASGQAALTADVASLASGTEYGSAPRTVDNTEGAVDENPRQRRRVLDKRNPLATEYQSIGDIGSFVLPDVDSEGVNNRARFSIDNPFEGPERAISGEISYNYNNLSGNGFFQGKAAYSALFGEERRWAFSIRGERSGVDHVFEEVRMRWRTRDSVGQPIFLLDRLRPSRHAIQTARNQVGISVERRLRETHGLYIKTHLENRKDTEFDQRIRMAIGQGDVASLTENSGSSRNAAAERSIRNFSEQRNRFRVIAGGSFSGNQSRIDYSYYFSHWERKELGNINPIFRAEGIDYGYALNNPAFPTVAVLNSFDLNDPTQFSFSEYTVTDVVTSDNDHALQLNFERHLAFGTLSGIFKTGAVFRSKERKNSHHRKVADAFDGAFSMDMVVGRDPGTVVRNTYTLGPGVDPVAFRAFAQSEQERFHFDPGRAHIESDTSNYRAAEEVTGLFILQTIKGASWQVKGGVRFERTKLETNGNVVLTDVRGDYLATEPVNGSGEYSKWLPAIALNLSLQDSTRLSAAWFQALARPDYFDLVPYRRLYTNYQYISEGNPELKPTRFNNFVVGAHLKNSIIGQFSISGYHKKLEAFFYDSEVLVSGGPYDGFTQRRKENGNDATVWGFEMGWKHDVGSLPEFAGDLALAAFYTFSETEADVDIRPDDKLDLPERSRHFAALTAKHSIGPLETVFSLSYQSRFLEEIGETAQVDEFIDDSVRLKLAFDLRIAKGVRPFVRFTNITDRPERSFEGDSSRFTQNEYNSWKLETGIRIRM